MITAIASVALIVNELMAANVGEVLSPAINFDSWIELYNPGDEAVNLGGMYLSDDASNLKRWQMPRDIGSIPAKGYFVVWLGSNDIKETQANFKLDCDGGTIYLSNAQGQLVTSQEYPEAISHTAWARTSDGGDTWGWTANATLARAMPQQSSPTNDWTLLSSALAASSSRAHSASKSTFLKERP